MQRSTSIALVAPPLCPGLAACSSAKKSAAAPVAATGTTTDGHSAPATLLGAVPGDDLAVLRVKSLPLSPPRSPTPASSSRATS